MTLNLTNEILNIEYLVQKTREMFLILCENKQIHGPAYWNQVVDNKENKASWVIVDSLEYIQKRFKIPGIDRDILIKSGAMIAAMKLVDDIKI